MEETEARTLLVSWSVSRGRDTYGYNICRLDDTATQKRYRCMGGGYDMLGTVFGDWLQDVAQDKLRAIGEESYAVVREGQGYMTRNNPGHYGMTAHYSADSATCHLTHVTLDGACGIESMRRIAEAVGIGVRSIVRKGQTVGFAVTGV